MDFHQSPIERYAERIFEHLCKEFDGKKINSNECNLNLMKKSFPHDFDEMEYGDPEVSETQLEVFSDNIDEISESIHPETTTSQSSNNVKKIKKVKKPKEKKEKKEKKENKDKKEKKEKKPKKEGPLVGYFYYKDLTENKILIEKFAAENDFTDKRKAAGALWKSLTQEEKDFWTQKSKDSYELKKSQESSSEVMIST